MEAKKDMVTRRDLCHDRHTVSLLTDHLVFSPKYRGKVLEGEIAEAAEEIIRENCKELDIEIIDMAMNIDHVHLFIKYPPKYSVSWIAKRLKGRSSKQTLLEKAFTEKCFAASQSVGHGWEVVERYISGQKGYEKTDTVPVIDEEKEKLKAHKTWYTSLYNKLFGGKYQK